MAIDLSQLPSVSFAETDSTTIEAAIINTYEAVSGRTLAQADPVRLFLLSIAEIIIQQRIVIDNAGKMNLLAYAKGNYLDQIGALVDCAREQAAAATTTLQFTISAIQPSVITIPAGTRVSVGSLVFATTDVASVPITSTTVTVPAKCTTTGTIGNGYLAGQITHIVDVFPFFQAVTNTTTTSGGTDTEENDAYRLRIQQAPESFSVAGPDGAYEYWAKTASSAIADVSVTSPSPGNVQITVLMENGALPTADIIAEVQNICSARNIRPLSDHVAVVSPTPISYNINVSYSIDAVNASLATSIQAAVQTAVSDYISWQNAKLGRDIDPSQLTSLMVAAGAKNVAVISPVFTTVSDIQVAQLGTSTVTYGGTN